MTEVTLRIATKAGRAEIDRFIGDLLRSGVVNSRDNEEGEMITGELMSYEVESTP